MSINWNILAADVLEQRIEFARLPHGWAAVGAIVLLILLLNLVVFLYRREQRTGASPRRRMLLAGLRCTVILVLALVWLEPVLATYVHRTIESFTLLLVDHSASMGLHDRYPDPAEAGRVDAALAGATPATQPAAAAADLSRADLVEKLLARDDARLLRELAERNTVQVFRFADKLTPVGQVTAGGEITPDSGPDGIPAATRPVDHLEGSGTPSELLHRADSPLGAATDIGRAVRQAVESLSGSPVAGIVVLSDGRFNHGEPAEVVARYARSKRIPVIAVGIGDPSPPRNVTVATLEAPPNVFVKDPFKVTAHLRAQGLDGTRLSVELLERGAGSAQPTVVETRPVTVGPGGQIPPLVFDRKIGEAQEVRLTVRVAPQEAETLTDDNQQEVAVRALENKTRVLLVSGGPTWEYQYLSRLLERDATINLSCWLQSADEEAVRDGNTVIDHFPRKQEELFQYDLIILLDPQPGDFDPAWTAHIESLVGSYGGGLLFIAGRINTPRFAHDVNTRALLDLLPVVLDANEADLMLNELGHFQLAGWPLAVPPAVAGHPVMALSDQPGETQQIWNRLPGVYWHYPVRREKPVATAFLRHSNPRMRNSYGGHVLLASQFFGAGRTGFLAYDGTWRWRRYGDRYFNRFWIQLLRHLVEGKLLSGQQRGLIQIERDRYAVGEAVVVEARLLDSRNLPLEEETVEATVAAPGAAARRLVLKAQPNRPGWYRGQYVPTELGTHSVQIDLPGGSGSEPAAIRGEIRVGRAELEFLRPELDREALQLLATGSAGGKYLNVDEVDQLSGLIPSRTASLVLTGQPTLLWDRWWTLAAVVGLLGLEWLIRKRSHLL
ncbi:MAG: hypothetical protein AMXMBFR13_37310 [Phycisphaerae bacterium]